MSLFDASVDLNPHQIEAALFACRSPLSKGVLLADEVGLGKTIEAGLVLCQYWAERRRRLIVICPAALRKQWSLELAEKFNLPSMILEAKSFKEALRSGSDNPFSADSIVITSLNFATLQKELVKLIPWDLAVISTRRTSCVMPIVPATAWAKVSVGHWRIARNCCSPPRRCRTRCWSYTDCPP